MPPPVETLLPARMSFTARTGHQLNFSKSSFSCRETSCPTFYRRPFYMLRHKCLSRPFVVCWADPRRLSVFPLFPLTVEIDGALWIRKPLALPEQPESHVCDLTSPPGVDQHVTGLEATVVHQRRLMDVRHTLETIPKSYFADRAAES